MAAVALRQMRYEESAVNHILLDAQDDAVKRFFNSLPADPRGSVIELEGRPIACVLPLSNGSEPAGANEPWTEQKNARRCSLIDKEIAGTLTPEESVELHGLQQEMLRHRRRTAPLPLEDARRLHRELLDQAGSTSPGG